MEILVTDNREGITILSYDEQKSQLVRKNYEALTRDIKTGMFSPKLGVPLGVDASGELVLYGKTIYQKNKDLKKEFDCVRLVLFIDI